MNTLLVIDELRAWLQSQPLDEVVGQAGCAWSCPVAQYLRNMPGVFDAVVEPDPYEQEGLTLDDGFVIINEGDPYTLPRWATAFALEVDRLWSDESAVNDVTASQALAILDSLRSAPIEGQLELAI